MHSFRDSMRQFFSCYVAILDASWAPEMIFDLEKSLFDDLKWARFVSFLLIGTELIYSERIFQAINVWLNALFYTTKRAV